MLKSTISSYEGNVFVKTKLIGLKINSEFIIPDIRAKKHKHALKNIFIRD